MKTGRRGFLGRLAAGAAAIVGASQMPRVAEAASIRVDPEQEWLKVVKWKTRQTASSLEHIEWPNPVAHNYITTTHNGYGVAFNAAPGVYERTYAGVVINAGASDRHYLRILNADGTIKADYPSLTFEAMQADCEARGCSISAVNTLHRGEWYVTHKMRPAERGSISQYLESDLSRVDAWRRSLHESVDVAPPSSDLRFTDSAIRRGDGPTGWYRDADGAKTYLVDGVRVDQSTFHRLRPWTGSY